ncbi:free fatty acid receptor 2 [Paramormyrops kingsleyae]|uniref:free fatty acid receptor 2 n=1 Tax=Paramormyrops kingsleyae TaxID=1676925 RepID=UPI000CD65752|nr:free fatty acid receptor 2-like [Paramormyrops kingsleyae]XP_023668775.1 free fatty acid receptor 2-like [Paramormyrops kingsleyae]
MTEYWSHEFSLAVYIITFVTGLPANVLAFYTFTLKVKQKPTPIDILLLNLTVSDLIFLIFLPCKMIEAADGMHWNMPYFLCPLSGFIFYTTIYNSTFFLTAISVERYLGVAFPIKYKLNRRPLYAVIASVFFWVVSMSHISIVYIMHYTGANSSIPKNVCYEDFSKEQLKILLPVRLELFLVLFCIPFLICSFCYIKFIYILSRLPHISPHRRQRAIGLALGTLLVFIMCFGPYNLTHVVGFVTGGSPKWRAQAVLFSTFNACLDPIIFYCSSSTVRKMLNRILKDLVERLHMRCCQCPQWSCVGTEESTTQSSNDTT